MWQRGIIKYTKEVGKRRLADHGPGDKDKEFEWLITACQSISAWARIPTDTHRHSPCPTPERLDSLAQPSMSCRSFPNTSDVIDGGGGTNTVVYRGPSSNYTVAKQGDGSYLVTSASTAEGPE